MFKLTGKSGSRAASPTSQTSRVSGLTQLRGSMPPHPRQPPFQPDTAQDHVRDIKSPRVDEA